MIPFDDYLRGLDRDGEVVTVTDAQRGDIPIDVLAAEALDSNGPALRFERTDGVDLASGVFSGPDQMHCREAAPWSRLSLGLGLDDEASLVDLLDTVVSLGPAATPGESTYTPQAAARTLDDLQALGLPRGGEDTWPSITLGVASVTTEAGTHWAPIHGVVVSTDTLRVRVPAGLAALTDDEETVTIALGVPPAALTAAYLLAVTDRVDTPLENTGIEGTVPLVPTNGGRVPSSTEVLVETNVADTTPGFRPDRREAWEHATTSTSLTLDVTRVVATEDPLIAIAPVGRPMADDLQLTGLTAAAHLYHRVNNYWGISPIEWLLLPPSTELGVCFVASDVLYAGFEWQLANILFSFSSLFDTVVIVDEDVPPWDFGRVLSDIWVKAHPSRDWLFSEPDAPAAKRPNYRQDGTTGARLYVNATWDPRWDDSYLAPRVTFEESFPESVRTLARQFWAERQEPTEDDPIADATDDDSGA